MPDDGNNGDGGANSPEPTSGDGGATAPAPTSTTPTPAGDESQLGDAGKQALQTERAARSAAEREARTAKAELARLQERTKSDEEKALDAARKEGREEANKTANARILRAEVTAVAGGKLADPSDAPRYLDLSEFEVADDGSVDRKGIDAAIAQLLKEKPYLAAKPARPTGDAGGGPQGSGDGEGPDMDSWIREHAKRG